MQQKLNKILQYKKVLQIYSKDRIITNIQYTISMYRNIDRVTIPTTKKNYFTQKLRIETFVEAHEQVQS